jgi:Yip1 domain
MSDPNQAFQPPPPPATIVEPERPRPVKLMWAGIALIVLGIIIAIGGIANFIPGGTGTGLSLCALGILLALLSLARLPVVADPPPPMSTIERLAGIFYEPTRVFQNLRAHPRWLAAILCIGVLNAAYMTAFTRRITPERIINFTVDKLDEGSFKPPPEVLAKMRTEGVEQAKSPAFQAGNFVKTVVGAFFSVAFVAGLCLLGVLAFGGRMHFWQAYAVIAHVMLPFTVLQKGISFIILFIKSPDDIHPILGQESLVTDNLGLLFAAKDHPVLWVVATSIGVLSFYRLWLTATGLREGGYKVSSSAGWGVAITLFVIFLLFGMAIAAIFPGFLS